MNVRYKQLFDGDYNLKPINEDIKKQIGRPIFEGEPTCNDYESVALAIERMNQTFENLRKCDKYYNPNELIRLTKTNNIIK